MADSTAMEQTTLLSSKQSTGVPEADMYKKRLERSPHDASAWMGLLRVARSSNNDELLYAAYSSALAQYPSSGHLLATFVELELSRGNKSSAESIFNNNLFNVPSIELWQSYLNYVLKANVEAGVDVPPENRSTVMECFKLVLDNVGADREAGRIWIDYISFINSAQTHAPYEEQQRTDLLRETYQTAVSIPLLRVEEIWKSYDAFETRVDRMGAKQQLSKISPSYMTARTALREMNRFWDTIRATQSNTLPQPPGWTAREVEHLDAWKRYLKWEVSNPLRLGGPDAHKRVIYAYNQACMELWLYPEVWIEFAEYYTTIGQQSDALTKLQTASSVLPESLAVQFAYAETAEKMKQLDVCKQVYEDVVATQRLHMERITEKYTHKLAKLDKRLEKRLEKPSGPDQNQTADQSSSDSDMDDFDDADDNASIGSDSDGGDALAFGEDAKLKRTAQRTARLRKAVEQRKDAINVRMEDELTERREAFTLVWIMYLRYIQRSEGIDAVRQLLKRSRSEPHGYITHHFYVAAALMEYHVGKRPHVAGKLLKYYSKDYSNNASYIVEYMNYLANSGDDTNLRAEFERYHSTPVGDTNEMWTMFADFEYNYGDLSAIDKLDRRFINKFAHESVLTRMATRYSYMDVDCVAAREFGFPYRKDIASRAHSADTRSRNANTAIDASGLRVHGESESGSEMLSVGVASVTGRYLNKQQLLAPVTPNKFAKPSVNALREYDPVVEPFVPPESPMRSASSNDYRAAPTMSPGPQFKHLLDQGDVLSYVAAAIATPDVSSFDAHPLNIDALLGAIMQMPVGQCAPSNYRPLSYMPWASRSDSGGFYRSDSQSGYYRGDRGARPFNSRSRSRGRYDDVHRGGFQARHGSRGSHRQQPYARSPSYPNDTRSPNYSDGRSAQRGHGPRLNDRSNYRGRP
ncbi:mRNA 3'-end-processing protein rna14 [Coemansia sp. RSA 1822]|nr:mRNA 3'-end-processing protein rna14 [Coemansia sp. RSA 638]KAJ2545486.1 mRNA 3'-end-processing protein rna14 [Coemansia sp. RSA 1853]KAJ2567898.1 mRNA 3'-end-processing protein rna14 [Coemansia sp. RSA 1822]